MQNNVYPQRITKEKESGCIVDINKYKSSG